jgi:aspartyl-tRNA(Asn)/glutamyl-tRNA(Gln) amidotransferase subunit C
MIEIADIEKLAGLARIAVTNEEKIRFQQDLEAILNYVSELKDAPATEGDTLGILKVSPSAPVKNVMREDDDAFVPGEFTDEILAEAPNRAGGYFKVKKIFN